MAKELVELGRSRKWLPELGPNPIGHWTKGKTDESRRRALLKRADQIGCRRVRANLNALRNVQKDAETKRKMTQDFNWLQNACPLGPKMGNKGRARY